MYVDNLVHNYIVVYLLSPLFLSAVPVVSAENVTVMEMDGVAVVTFTRTGDLLLGSRFNVTLMSGSAISRKLHTCYYPNVHTCG